MVVLCSAFFRSVVHKGVFLGHYLTIPLIIQLLNNLIVSNLTYFLLQPIVSFVSSFQFPSKSNLLKILYIFTVHRIEFYFTLLNSIHLILKFKKFCCTLSWACFSSPHFIQLHHLQSEISCCNQQGISHCIYFIHLSTLHYNLCFHE